LSPPQHSPARELELVADALTFPTSVAFAADGVPLVAECGLGFGGARAGGRVLRLGRRRTVLAERLQPPVNEFAALELEQIRANSSHP
jgi:hypothetical protein